MAAAAAAENINDIHADKQREHFTPTQRSNNWVAAGRAIPLCRRRCQRDRRVHNTEPVPPFHREIRPNRTASRNKRRKMSTILLINRINIIDALLWRFGQLSPFLLQLLARNSHIYINTDNSLLLLLLLMMMMTAQMMSSRVHLSRMVGSNGSKWRNCWLGYRSISKDCIIHRQKNSVLFGYRI